MKQNATFHDTELHRPADIIPLYCKRECDLDEAQFVALFETKAQQEAEDVVFAALEDMAAGIEDIRIASHHTDTGQIQMTARRLSVIAKGVGLLSVARAASNVQNSAERADPVARSAAFERLDRCFDEAVTQVWNMFEAL